MVVKTRLKRFTPEAKSLIQKLPPAVKKPLRALTDEIFENPHIGKELRQELEGYRSARYSHYRVIYEFDESKNIITIHYLGERKDVYSIFEQSLSGLKSFKK